MKLFSFVNSVLVFVPLLFDARRGGEGKTPEWVWRSVTVEVFKTGCLCAGIIRVRPAANDAKTTLPPSLTVAAAPGRCASLRRPRDRPFSIPEVLPARERPCASASARGTRAHRGEAIPGIHYALHQSFWTPDISLAEQIVSYQNSISAMTCGPPPSPDFTCAAFPHTC